jgi:YHS domain-containing protein
MNAQSAESFARDPVCGQDVAMIDGALTEDYAGVVYYFSSQACLDRFNQDADIFTTGGPGGTAATHDRGLRASAETAGYAGHVLFEVTEVGAGPG